MRLTPARRAVVAAAGRGIGVGLLGAALFLSIHAVVVEPIWGAIPRALAVALVAGALVGVAYRSERPRLAGRGIARGLSFGGLFALSLVPCLVAGEALTRGHGPVAAAAALALGLPAVVLVVAAAGRGPARARVRRVAVVGAVALVLNAYPAYFLVNLSTLIDDRVPNPYPMTSVLAGIYLATGAALEAWTARAGE